MSNEIFKPWLIKAVTSLLPSSGSVSIPVKKSGLLQVIEILKSRDNIDQSPWTICTDGEVKIKVQFDLSSEGNLGILKPMTKVKPHYAYFFIGSNSKIDLRLIQWSILKGGEALDSRTPYLPDMQSLSVTKLYLQSSFVKNLLENGQSSSLRQQDFYHIAWRRQLDTLLSRDDDVLINTSFNWFKAGIFKDEPLKSPQFKQYQRKGKELFEQKPSPNLFESSSNLLKIYEKHRDQFMKNNKTNRKRKRI